MVVAGISGYLRGFLEFLRAEVVLEPLDLLLVAGWNLGQQADCSIGVPLDGVELEVEFGSKFEYFLAYCLILDNLIHLCLGQFFIVVRRLLNDAFIVILCINFFILPEVGHFIVNPGEGFRFRIKFSLALKSFDHIVKIKFF